MFDYIANKIDFLIEQLPDSLLINIYNVINILYINDYDYCNWGIVALMLFLVRPVQTTSLVPFL